MAKSVLQADAKRQGDTRLLRDVGRISSISAAASPPTEGKLVLPLWTDCDWWGWGGGRQYGGRLQHLRMETCLGGARATPWQDLATLPRDTAYRKEQAPALTWLSAPMHSRSAWLGFRHRAATSLSNGPPWKCTEQHWKAGVRQSQSHVANLHSKQEGGKLAIFRGYTEQPCGDRCRWRHAGKFNKTSD